MTSARHKNDDPAAHELSLSAGWRQVGARGSKRHPLTAMALATATTIAAGGQALADQVIADDLIVQGGLCAGFDCINNESFGFDTLRLKENNVRIHFDDTSTAFGFPANDWRIVINDSASGGNNYFGIDDATANRRLFELRAGAPANSLFVAGTGDVGFGTAGVAASLHISREDPRIRMTNTTDAIEWEFAAGQSFTLERIGGGTAFRFDPANSSSAFGTHSRAAAANAVALGTGLLDDGAGNNLAGAEGNFAIAAGFQARAAAESATAVGQNARALALRSTALGFASVALSNNSLALGRSAQARAARSVALGHGSIATAADTVSVGTPGSEKRIVNVADAINATDAVNLGQVQAMLAGLGSGASVSAALSGAVAARGGESRPATGRQAATSASLRENARPTRGNNSASLRGSESSAATASADELEPSEIVGWANVRRDGSVSRARNVAETLRREAGEYEIAFAKPSLAECTFNVNRSGAGFVSVEPGSSPNSIRIETRNHYGVLSDAAFYVMAVC